jgi:predicted SAM-dependent methyltransferase
MKLLNLGCGNRYHPSWVNVDIHPTGPSVVVHDLERGIPFPDNSFSAVYHSHLLEHLPKADAPGFLRECLRVLQPGGILRVVVPDLEKIARLYLEALDGALKGDEVAETRYDWILLEMLDQMVRDQSGGEMLKYWKQNPMPAESFVIERVGSEVLEALAALRQQGTDGHAGQSEGGSGAHEERDPTRLGEFRLSGEPHQWMYDRYSLRLLLQEAGFHDMRVCRAGESSIPGFNSYLFDIEADGSVRKPDSLFMEGQK